MNASGSTLLSTTIARMLLIILIGISSYIAFTPNINLAHWTPNRTMRDIGFSYASVLTYEQHFNWFLHIMVGFFLTILLHISRFYFPNNSKTRLLLSMLIVFCMAVVAELIQLKVGRQVEFVDLLLGIVGITLGFAVIRHIVDVKHYD